MHDIMIGILGIKVLYWLMKLIPFITGFVRSQFDKGGVGLISDRSPIIAHLVILT
jgi:hypothetical protein